MIVNPYVFGGSATSTLLNGLYALWKLEINANDSLGNYNGTLIGTQSYGSGINGNCVVPSGSNYVDLPDNTFNSLGTTFTIAVWVYPDLSTSGNRTIVSTYNSTYGATAGFELDTTIDGTGMMFNLFGSSSVSIGANSGSLISFQWNLIIIERTASTSTKVYINNVFKTQNSSTMDILYAPQLYASIGAYKYSSSGIAQYMAPNHKYDELAFWNRALTTQEKTDLWNSGTGKFYPTFL